MSTLVAALYASTNYPDISDRCLQPASLRRTATLSLVVAKPRPLEHRRIDHDAGIDRRYVGCAPRGCYGGCRSPAGYRSDQLCPRPHTDPRSPEIGSYCMRVLSSRQRRVRSVTWMNPACDSIAFHGERVIALRQCLS